MGFWDSIGAINGSAIKNSQPDSFDSTTEYIGQMKNTVKSKRKKFCEKLQSHSSKQLFNQE